MAMNRRLGNFLKTAAACCGVLLLQGSVFAAGSAYSYTLSNPQLQHLYPNAADTTMPSFYANQKSFPQTLAQSIQLYTQQSLVNDGIQGNVAVTVNGSAATVTITSADPKAASYGAMMAGFVSGGAIGWSGALQCQQSQASPACWGNPIKGGQPWAFFLPLGLPTVNQVAVTFLDYPPNASLCTSNYLSNFTTARWNAVMQMAGVTNPVLYEAIVDAHPIAAPGSGQGTYVDATSPYFAGNQGYDNTMLGVLVNPPGNAASKSTLPVLVLGTPARTSWSQLIGQPVPVSGAGTATLPGQSKPTKWIAGNHPDVTTYQCCPGDPTSSCKGSYSLVQDEIIDLGVACTIKALAENPAADPGVAQATCSSLWNSAAQQHNVCIQARLDYDFMSKGMPCKCQYAADQFCGANADNACATGSSGVPLSCSSYDSLCDGTTPARTPPQYQYPGCAN
ncbi:MAG: hypothetical protein KGZ83_15920 [Sulfuricella sp.]|nr:hypothetical protein [Sulfuricella sp.]